VFLSTTGVKRNGETAVRLGREWLLIFEASRIRWPSVTVVAYRWTQEQAATPGQLAGAPEPFLLRSPRNVRQVK